MDAPVAFLNGEFLPADAARLSFYDAGFVQGATVTDLLRTFHLQPFRKEQHIARFRASCQQCRVPLLHDDATIDRWICELVRCNCRLLPKSAELGIVLFATPGQIGTYAGVRSDGPPTLGMHTFPLPVERYRRFYSHGARLVVPNVRQVPASCISPQAKQRSRMHWWIGKQEAAERDPMADALLLDLNGYVTETASANVLVVRDNVVSTPPADCVLPGVTLSVIRELCAVLGIEYRERRLSLDDCLTADEMLLTCTTWCLAGVSWLNNQPIPWPGPLYERLANAFSSHVGVSFRLQ